MVSCPLLPRNSGVFGVEKFFKFLQKEGFGADFHPSKQPQGDLESSFNRSPACFAPQKFFEDFFFPPCFPSSKLPKAVTPEKDRKTPTRHPHLRKVITSGDIKLPETTKKPRGEPRGFSGAVDET